MRQLSLCGLVMALLATALCGCNGSDVLGEAPRHAPDERAAVQIPIVVFAPPGQPRAAVTVELARTPREIRRGLMYRRSLPERHGMLFLMGEERVHSFWMRNTYIPLDMIFIGKDRKVAGVVANATPLTETSRHIDRPSYYVLEVNAGWAAANHIAAGTPVRFKNIPE